MSGEHIKNIKLGTSNQAPLPPQNAASHNYDDHESNNMPNDDTTTTEISSCSKLIDDELSHHYDHPSRSSSSSSRGHFYRRGKIRIICIGSFIVLASAAFLLEGQVRYEKEGGYFGEEVVEHDAWYENGLNDDNDDENVAGAGVYVEHTREDDDNEYYDFEEETSYHAIEDNGIDYSSEEESDEMQSDIIGSGDFDAGSSDDFKKEYISEEDDNFGIDNNSKDAGEYDDQYDSGDIYDERDNDEGNDGFHENSPGVYNEEYISEEDDNFGMEDISEDDDIAGNEDVSQDVDGYSSQDEENTSEDSNVSNDYLSNDETTEDYLSEEGDDDGFSYEEDIYHPEQMYDMPSEKPPPHENAESRYSQEDDDGSSSSSSPDGSISSSTDQKNKEYITDEEIAFDSAIKSIDDLPISPPDKSTIIFWHIPRTSGTSLQRILGECLGLTLANERGIIDHENDTHIKVVSFPNEKHGTFVNVDTSTLEGLARAKELGLVSSGLADVIVAMRIYAALTLFDDDDDNKGRLFTLMRHPVRRAISEFYHLAHANWEHTFHGQWANMTLLEYATRPGMEENWMVRSLSNRLSGAVGPRDLEMAKVILRDKCLLGFMDDGELIADAMDRFEKYFGWDEILRREERAKECHDEVLGHGVNGATYDVVDEDSPEWEMIARRNELDVRLYEYAKEVYEEQGAFLYDEGII